MELIERQHTKTRDRSRYVAYGGSAELFQCTAKEVLFEGPANCGKTRGVLEYCLMLLTEFPGLRMLWLRKTRKALSESVLTTWEEHVLPKRHACIHGTARKENRSTYEFPNGSVVVLGGMDNPDKVMSTEYDVEVYFEATEGNVKDWNRMVTRARNKRILLGLNAETGRPLYFHQIIADCNPGPENHWLNERAKVGHMHRIRAKHSDNPLFDEDDQERLDSLTGVDHDRLALGLWVSAEGMVWPMWDREKMMCFRRDLLKDKDRPTGGYRFDWVFASLDWGMVDAQVFQVWGVIDGSIYLVAEIYRRMMSPIWWGDRIAHLKQKWGIQVIVADSSDPAQIGSDPWAATTSRGLSFLCRRAPAL